MEQSYLWPGGARCAVMVSVLFDDALDAIAQAPDLLQRSKSLSVWQYGARRGVARLHAALAAQQVPATWFMPVRVVERYPGLVTALQAAGQGLACRGVEVEQPALMAEAARWDYLQALRQQWQALTGSTPAGYRLPAGRWPLDFDQQLVRAGFTWSATLNGDDCPYHHDSGLIEIPVHLELEDRPFFQFNFTPAFPKGHSRLPAYQGVLDNWIREFDAYRQYGLCFVLQLRPEMTGTPGRIGLVEALLAHMRQFDDVWFATGDQIAQWHRQQQVPTAARHPIHVFKEYRCEPVC